ncbi:unnamed protein product [Rhizophagus irregularis]|nr:unnamed protein product [Rhizophagus irregularis]CAB4442849.1 unnamed protein product [Rhizophagus irregularis]
MVKLLQNQHSKYTKRNRAYRYRSSKRTSKRLLKEKEIVIREQEKYGSGEMRSLVKKIKVKKLFKHQKIRTDIVLKKEYAESFRSGDFATKVEDLYVGWYKGDTSTIQRAERD